LDLFIASAHGLALAALEHRQPAQMRGAGAAKVPETLPHPLRQVDSRPRSVAGNRLLAMVRSYVLRSPAVASRDVSRSEPLLRNFARDTAVDSHWNVVVRTCAQRPPRRSSAADSSATRAASRRRSSMAARPSSSAIGVCISLATSSNMDHRFPPRLHALASVLDHAPPVVCAPLQHRKSGASPGQRSLPDRRLN
jgi:hypothetical protein